MVSQPPSQQAEEPHEVLGLIVEWFDPQPQLVKQFILKVSLTVTIETLADVSSPNVGPRSRSADGAHALCLRCCSSSPSSTRWRW